MDRRLADSLANLQRAQSNFDSALTLPSDQELVKEGTIHRFETLLGVFWKTLQRALEYEGLQAHTPRNCIKEAFRLGWINDEATWLSMLDLRNITSHEYLDEALAEANYREVRRLAPAIREASGFLAQRFL
jgi:nucleotidyltransferase substrate binding protein (TIGR01987 family)